LWPLGDLLKEDEKRQQFNGNFEMIKEKGVKALKNRPKKYTLQLQNAKLSTLKHRK
jgi:hypothetical protein